MLRKIAQKANFASTLHSFPKKSFHQSKVFKAQIEIFINDRPIKVDSSYSIFQACHEAGVIIPRFCYHERLAVAGNCRMCLVEVEKSPKPVAACAAQVLPGMRILTNSEKTRIARGGVMEFLLANHPLDCPICDQGGECDLQDISQVYGYKQGRFMEYKRAVEDKNLGPLISTIMTRCIHCTRCIRFSEEIAGVLDLGTSGRGNLTEIGTYIPKMIDNELSGNLVDLCPVGALTNGPYAFTSRPWELKSVETVDVMETLGASIQIDYRGAEIMRVLPRIHEEVNEEWISDKTRHAFDGLKRQRLTVPLAKVTQPDGRQEFVEQSWEEVLPAISKKLLNASGDEIAAIVGEFADCEGLVALKDLLNRFDCDNFEIRNNSDVLNGDLRGGYLMNSRITGVEESDLLLLVGANPKYESPVFNARILKATKRNNLRVAVIGTANDLNYKYLHLGTTMKSLVEIAEGKHPFAKTLKEAKLPMIVVGNSVLYRRDAAAIMGLVKKISLESPVLNKTLGWNGFNVLQQETGRLSALELGLAEKNAKLNKKNLKVLFIMGADNRIRVEDIPKDAFVVYIGTHGDEGAYFADYILPAAAYTEKSCTFVNMEGRVQLSRLVVMPPGMAKEDWQIIRALSEECGQTLPYDNLEEIRYRMAELAPHLMKYDYVEPSIFAELALKSKPKHQQKITMSPVVDNIDNYYMTDAISRASLVMAKCSTAFNQNKFSNFRKV